MRFKRRPRASSDRGQSLPMWVAADPAERSK